MLPAKPTQIQMQQADGVIRSYAAHDRGALATSARQSAKDRALAAECEQLSNELYKQIRAALPDEHSREMFASFALLIGGKYTLEHATYDTTRSHGVYAWAVKQARKLLARQ